MKDKLSELIKSGKVNLSDCVVIVPLKMYEQLIADCKDVEENELVEVHHDGVRIMWAHIPESILVTKEVYNQIYNPCSFAKLEVS